MKFKLTIIFLLFLISLEAKGLEKVSLQLQWLDQFQFAGYYIAKEKGFYEDIGLDVEIKKYSHDINIVNDVRSQKTTYGIGRSSLIIDMSKRKDIVLLSAVFQSSPLVMLATKESNITMVKDFIGKRIMVTPEIGSMVSLQAMANQNEVVKENVVQIQHSYDVNDLINQKADLMTSYISNEPYLLKERGIDYTIFDPKDYGFDFYSDLLFTSENEVLNHKKRTQNFRDASNKGWEYAFSHIDETVELIYSKYNSQSKSKEALRFEAETLKKLAYYKTDAFGHLDLHKLQRIYDIYNVFGFVHKKIDFDKFLLSGRDTISLDLNEKEKQWIKDHPVVTYSEVNWKPLSIIDNGQMKGIMGDYLEFVSNQTGIDFKFVPSNSWSHVLQQFKDKKIDLVPGVGSSDVEKELGLISNRYAKYPMVIVTGDKYKFIESLEALNGKTVAVPKHYTSYNFLIKMYPEIKLKTTNTIEQALILVENGQADAFIGHIATSLFYISQLNLSNLKISGITSFEFEHHYLIQEQDPEFLSIINKTFHSIPESERAKIYANWVHTIVEKQIDYTLVFQILVGLFVFLLFLLYRETTISKYTQALEKTQEQFTLGQKIAQIGIWTFDHLTDTLEWTDGVHDIFGTDSKTFEVTFETFMNYIHPDDKAKLLKAYSDSIVEKRDYFVEHRIILDDGTIKYLQARCQNFFDDEGTILHSTGTVLDISTQKGLEEEILRINKNLEEKVDQRTTAIKEKDRQLLQQSRMAQMGEMISMIAHQWRQPLGAISSTSIDMNLKFQFNEFDLEQKEERDKCKVYILDNLGNIDGFVQNLTNTIDDFRNFYKPNKRSITALMNVPVKKALNIVKASFASDGVKILEEYRCKNKVNMHQNELMQVILNVLKNSQDNFRENNIKNGEIWIKTYDLSTGVRLEISDNGGGISEDNLQKIFDPYFSTKSEKNGTGLGLYMSKTIIELHHKGKLYAKNRDDGICFFIELNSEKEMLFTYDNHLESVIV